MAAVLKLGLVWARVYNYIYLIHGEGVIRRQSKGHLPQSPVRASLDNSCESTITLGDAILHQQDQQALAHNILL